MEGSPPSGASYGSSGVSAAAGRARAGAAGVGKRVLEASVPGTNLKHFASAITCLGRVGKEVQLEGQREKLILRTLNDAKTAFVALYFDQPFFESFRCEGGGGLGGGEGERGDENGEEEEGGDGGGSSDAVTCKVLIKAIHNVFKSLRKVQRMVIALDDVVQGDIEPRLVLQMQCEYQIKKSHNFLIQECEVSHAVFDQDGISVIDSSTQLLLQSVFNHMKGTSDVSALITDEELRFRSYHDQMLEPSKNLLKTETRIPAKDFESFTYRGDNKEEEMIFSLKEMRAFLSFCEAAGLDNLQLRFSRGGRPILMSAGNMNFQIELMMATMGVEDESATGGGGAEEDPSKGVPSLTSRYKRQKQQDD